MKKILVKLFLKLYKTLIWKEPCVIYKRYYEYKKNPDWFINNCPFCAPECVVGKFNYFNIIKNKYPYPNTKEHLLIIPIRHIVKYKEINKEELKELQNILWEYMSKWYLLLWRQFWDHKESSVAHLHLHLIKEDS